MGGGSTPKYQNCDFGILIGKDIKTDEANNITANSTNADITNSSYSFIQGETILSQASKSFISGNNIIAYQSYNLSLGQNIYNNSQFNLSVGDLINENGLYSINVGYKIKNTGQKAFSLGEKILNKNSYTFSVGNNITSNSDHSIISGNNVSSNGSYSLVCGSNITTNNLYNIVSGDSNDASGAFIFGSNNKAQESFVFGDQNTNEVDSCGLIGYGNILKDFGYSYIVGSSNEISNSDENISSIMAELPLYIDKYYEPSNNINNGNNYNFILGIRNYIGYKTDDVSIRENYILGSNNLIFKNSLKNNILGNNNALLECENCFVFGVGNEIKNTLGTFAIGRGLFGLSKFNIGINEEVMYPFINTSESDYFNLYGGKLVLRVTENQELIAPEQTKEKIANNDLFLVTREYVDPPVISKTPDDEQTITIDFSRERYTTTIPLTTDITKIKAINVKPGQSGKIFIKQDNAGGRKIELIGGRFVWETNDYDDIQPNQTKNWVTIYNYFVYGELTIVLKKEYEFLYNQQLAVNTSLDKLAVNTNGDTLLV